MLSLSSVNTYISVYVKLDLHIFQWCFVLTSGLTVRLSLDRHINDIRRCVLPLLWHLIENRPGQKCPLLRAIGGLIHNLDFIMGRDTLTKAARKTANLQMLSFLHNCIDNPATYI